MSKEIKLKFWPIAGIIAFAALSRILLLGVHNVSPITAIALFGGAYFAKKNWAYLVPFLAMWITDIILNNTIYAQYFEGFVWHGNLWVYGAFFLIVMIGIHFLKKVRPLNLLITTIGASLLFFVLTNFGVWAGSALYPKTIAGLIECYTLAIPFYQNTLIGDLLCTAVLFGGFELVRYQFPNLVYEDVN